MVDISVLNHHVETDVLKKMRSKVSEGPYLDKDSHISFTVVIHGLPPLFYIFQSYQLKLVYYKRHCEISLLFRFAKEKVTQ